jgi:2-octaprenyl-6-methoxyphenol hydroxylase
MFMNVKSKSGTRNGMLNWNKRAGQTMAERTSDVLIVGGGFAGLALALALRQGLGPSFRISVLDPAFGRHPADARASAISAGVRRLFETIGVWDAVDAQAQPILDMVITDSKVDSATRPVLLSFAGDVEPGEPFAHMIENAPLVGALTEKAKDSGIVLSATTAVQFATSKRPKARMGVELVDGTEHWAELVVAADGAHSRLRESAGIQRTSWTYPQAAIVTTVAHERDHGGRAEEHFLPAGPFAILPLKGRRSSIVWTEDAEEAERIVSLPDQDFHSELELRFGLHLGEIEVIGPRRAFPLELAIARSFVANRLALVGDAAHVIHPIAGQGLNLGLRDVAALAECITDAARLGFSPGDPGVLARYQRWRRFDTILMGVVTDGLNRLFSNRSDIWRLTRDLGLGVVDRLPQLKTAFVYQAAGLAGETPKLLRGQAL